MFRGYMESPCRAMAVVVFVSSIIATLLAAPTARADDYASSFGYTVQLPAGWRLQSNTKAAKWFMPNWQGKKEVFLRPNDNVHDDPVGVAVVLLSKPIPPTMEAAQAIETGVRKQAQIEWHGAGDKFIGCAPILTPAPRHLTCFFERRGHAGEVNYVPYTGERTLVMTTVRGRNDPETVTDPMFKALMRAVRDRLSAGVQK